MKPLIISSSDMVGGAPRAANRLHRAFISKNIESSMRVNSKQSDDWRVSGPLGKIEQITSRLYPVIEKSIIRLQHTSNPVLHSSSRMSCLTSRELNKHSAEVINLHWLGSGFLSIEELSKTKKPIVWTLHDMWAFCGAEHYAPEDENSRWKQGYTKLNRYPEHMGLDIDRWTWRRKKRAWKSPFHIITPSKWLADCAENSDLMHDWPITVVPNPLNTEIFRPLPKQVAREILGLPMDGKLILFGAIGGGSDPRKGWDLLQGALSHLNGKLENTNAVIFGQSEPQNSPQLGLPLHWMGHLHDDSTLALLYSAVDVTVVPSRQENLPQSATEAQACGCPVVAFNTTGLSDAVEHGKTGYLAEPFSTDDLANGIVWILEHESEFNQLSKYARERAVALWSPEVVVPQYLDVYKNAVSSRID